MQRPANLTMVYTYLTVTIADGADHIAANGAHSVPSGPPAVAEWQDSYAAEAS